MADSEGSARRRKPDATPKTKKATTSSQPEPVESEEEVVERKKVSAKQKVDDEDASSTWVDALRVLTFLFLASCGLSYLISGGETLFWGMKNPPNYLRAEWWKLQIVRSQLSLPLVPSSCVIF